MLKIKTSLVALFAVGMITTPLVVTQPTPVLAAKKAHHAKRVTTKNYGSLTINQRKAFSITHADPTAVLSLDQKHTVPGVTAKTYYGYQLKLTNNTKHRVRFYFSNLKLNSLNTKTKKYTKLNVKPAYSAKHIVLTPKASKVVKNAVSFKISKFNVHAGKSQFYFLQYGKFSRNKQLLAGVQFGSN